MSPTPIADSEGPHAAMSPGVPHLPVVASQDVENDAAAQHSGKRQATPEEASQQASTKQTMYLPEFVGQERVLTPTQDAGKYQFNHSSGRGIAYRNSMDLDDTSVVPVQPNSIVEGTLCEGWLQVEVDVPQVEQMDEPAAKKKRVGRGPAKKTVATTKAAAVPQMTEQQVTTTSGGA